MSILKIISCKALQFKPPSLLVAIDLSRLTLKPLLHVGSLALINFLHLAILVTDYGYVLLGKTSLLSKLILEGRCLIDVVLARLCLSLER